MKTGHWEGIALRFQHAVPPHRPTEQDLASYAAAIGAWSRRSGRAPRAFILGVTPQLYHLPWPLGTDLVAVDHTAAMIEHVWPGPPEKAILADWLGVDLETGSRDVAVSDGGLNMLRFPDEVAALCRQLCRILTPGGLFVTRIYAAPAERETADTVLSDLRAGKVANLAVLKTRLWMALHERPEKGVAVADIWETVYRFAPDLAALETEIGWPEGHLRAIETYRDSANVYYFFGVDDIRRIFCDEPGGFALESVHIPSYDLGELCPTIVLRRI